MPEDGTCGLTPTVGSQLRGAGGSPGLNEYPGHGAYTQDKEGFPDPLVIGTVGIHPGATNR